MGPAEAARNHCNIIHACPAKCVVNNWLFAQPILAVSTKRIQDGGGYHYDQAWIIFQQLFRSV
jgi:hypothetical protein